MGKKDDVIISPVKGKMEPVIGPDAIMAMIDSDLEYLIDLYAGKRVEKFDMHFFQLYLPRDDKISLSFSGPFLGAPQSVMALEKLIALGARRIWVIGWCGSLTPRLEIGDLVIPEGALSEEGTSQHYPIDDKPVQTDIGLRKLIEKSANKSGRNFLKGVVWTTDAPFRETIAKIEEYKDKGILAVEMEMSALMTVAIYRNIELAALLTVSDELFDLKWKPGFSDQRLRKSSRLAAGLILELIKSSRDNSGCL